MNEKTNDTYWCKCGNCGELFIGEDGLAVLIFEVHQHWTENHGNIHIPRAGIVRFEDEQAPQKTVPVVTLNPSYTMP